MLSLPCAWLALSRAGHDVVHTSDLPQGTPAPTARREPADQRDYVVVTEDRGLRDRLPLAGSPRRLLVLTIGDPSDADLLALFEIHRGAVATALHQANPGELGSDAL